MASLIPVYQSEIAPAATRGRMVASHGILVISGYAMAAWAGYGCYFSTKAAFQWRFILAAQVLAPTLLLLSSRWIPE
jgi:hypothetical protein